MPRVNPQRMLANETNLAQRIAFEREKRQWSYEGAASRMTAAGYPIQASAIFKIEKGKPPRRLTVDELVGFAKVFETTIEDMLAPIVSVKDAEAMAILSSLATSLTTIEAMAWGAANKMVELLTMNGLSQGLLDTLKQMTDEPARIESDFYDYARLTDTELGKHFREFVLRIGEDAVRQVSNGQH